MCAEGYSAETSKQRFERSSEEWGLRFLSAREVRMIDELLVSVGEFGRDQLTVKSGKLRFVERIERIDALKYEGSE
jgi:hypothetical protein